MLVESLDLLVHELKFDLCASVAKVLAVEVHHEVTDDSRVILGPVMLRWLGLPISVCSEVSVACSVLPLPVSFQFGPIPYDTTSTVPVVGTNL